MVSYQYGGLRNRRSGKFQAALIKRTDRKTPADTPKTAFRTRMELPLSCPNSQYRTEQNVLNAVYRGSPSNFGFQEALLIACMSAKKATDACLLLRH